MKKKILHIISSVSWRGGEQQVHYLLNHYSDMYDTYLFCPEGAALAEKNKHKQDAIFTYKKRFGADVAAALKLKNVVLQNKIDLLHLHDPHAINTYTLARWLGLKVPAVIHRHVNFNVGAGRKYRNELIRQIICVSNTVKGTMKKVAEENKLTVVHPAIDVNRYSVPRAGKENRKIRIGIVSALEKEKNIGSFISIANKMLIKRSDIEFVIVGDGSLRSSLDMNNSSISFLGNRDDIPTLLSTFDVFLFTSVNEGFPLVLLEAMAARVPIVTHHFPSANELIEQDRTGFMYRTEEEAIGKIEILLSDVKINHTIIENAFNFAQQFNTAVMNQQVENLYYNIFRHA